MKKLLFLCFALISLVTFTSQSWAVSLQSNDYHLIKMFQEYLNSTRTMQAHFVQTSSDGGQAVGTFYLIRPNRFRFNYDPPVNFVIVSDGRSVTEYDIDLDQSNRVALSDTPADILTRDHIDMFSDLSIIDFQNLGDMISLTVIDPRASERFEVTFLFSPGEMALRQWTVKDPSGSRTTIALTGIQRNIPLDQNMFGNKR